MDMNYWHMNATQRGENSHPGVNFLLDAKKIYGRLRECHNKIT